MKYYSHTLYLGPLSLESKLNKQNKSISYTK